MTISPGSFPKMEFSLQSAEEKAHNDNKDTQKNKQLSQTAKLRHCYFTIQTCDINLVQLHSGLD
jgi:hypothetical protein